MKNGVPFIVAAASALLFCTPAGAGDYPMTFEQLDTDANGYISAEEAKARPGLADSLQASDQNGDGQLNSAEFSALEGQGRFSPPEDSEVAEPGAAPY